MVRTKKNTPARGIEGAVFGMTNKITQADPAASAHHKAGTSNVLFIHKKSYNVPGFTLKEWKGRGKLKSTPLDAYKFLGNYVHENEDYPVNCVNRAIKLLAPICFHGKVGSINVLLNDQTDVHIFYELIASENASLIHQVQLISGQVEQNMDDRYFIAARLPNYILHTEIRPELGSMEIIDAAVKCSTIFCVVNTQFAEKNIISFDIYLKTLRNNYFPASATDIPLIKKIMNYFGYGKITTDPPLFECRKEDISEFYDKLKEWREQNDIEYKDVQVNPQHLALVPKLRPYQRDAVKWMIYRENTHQKSTDQLDDLWLSSFEWLTLISGDSLFWSQKTGIMCQILPPICPPTLGGILADEMGLGKTVEVISLLLNHPKQQKDLISVEGMFIPCDEVAEVVENIVSLATSIVEGQNLLVKKNKPMHTLTHKKINKASKRQSLHAIGEVYYQPVLKKAFNSKKSSFRGKFTCFCGETDIERGRESHSIVCSECGSLQHRSCVNWSYHNLDDFYLCPQCQRNASPVESKCTLIISPSSICRQWFEEIKKHVRDSSLTVLVYEGVGVDGYMQPRTLSEFDVIICTYETLRAEVRYTDLKDNDRLRHVKRFSAPPSPMTSVNWWRICLDEAQMVECVSTAAAAMCHRLPAVNRWCITGTPIQKSVMDLYGLVAFLNLQPYIVKNLWNLMLWQPYKRHSNYDPILNVLGPVLWRSEKRHVQYQLNIPNQTHELSWFSFGPVEEHFYRRTREKLHREMKHVTRHINEDVKLVHMDRHTVDKVMRPLAQLRKICCHPQVNTDGRLVPINQKVLTMDEVLSKMQKDTVRECKEEHRALVSSHNGLAGIYCLRSNWACAAEQYRQVMRSCTEHEGRLETDKLQRMHALYNLHRLITENRDAIPPTLRDDKLEDAYVQVENEFLKRAINSISEKQQQVHDAREAADNSRNELPSKGNDRLQMWLHRILSECNLHKLSVELVDRVKSSLMDRDGANKAATAVNRFVHSFGDTRGLGLLLSRSIDRIEECRTNVIEMMQKLDELPFTDPKLNQQTKDCHLRPFDGRSHATCTICVVDASFKEYELHLFALQDSVDDGGARIQRHLNRGIEEEELGEASKGIFLQQRKGNQADSPPIMAMKCILHYAKINDSIVSKEIIDCGTNFMQIIAQYRKEINALKNLWMAIEQLSALRDEVEMCKERLRLTTVVEEQALKDQERAKLVPKNAISKFNVEQNRLQLIGDQGSARANLTRKLRHLSYLTSLDGMKDNSRGNMDECPICQNVLGCAWAVFTCGHCFCQDCCKTMCDRHNNKGVTCAMCRVSCPAESISYVVSRVSEQRKHNIPVRGSYSTKIEEVVRKVIQIKYSNPNEKCLIFSSWQDVLEVVSHALHENLVQFMKLKGNQHYQSIYTFKNSPQCNVLLLPISSGANGLNIVEASHVLIVEPQINPAAEQQAVGRVHRIGQNKVTTVHRFLIKDSVEQQLHDIIGCGKSEKVSMSENETAFTVKQLNLLFCDPANQIQPSTSGEHTTFHEDTV